MIGWRNRLHEKWSRVCRDARGRIRNASGEDPVVMIVEDTDRRIVLKNDLSGRLLSVMGFLMCAGVFALFVSDPPHYADLRVYLWPFLAAVGAFYSLWAGFYVKEFVFDDSPGDLVVRGGTRPLVRIYRFKKTEIREVCVDHAPASQDTVNLEASPSRWTLSLLTPTGRVKIHGDIVESNVPYLVKRIGDFLDT